MPKALRSEVWQVDFGLAAKVRPALISKVSHQFSSRYTAMGLPLFLLVSSPFFPLSRASLVRTVIGAGLGMGALWSKPPIVLPSIVPKAQRLSLFRRHFQSKVGEPFFHFSGKNFRFVPPIERRHEVVRIPEQCAAPLLAWLELPFKP
jgi:hypothetical protein